MSHLHRLRTNQIAARLPLAFRSKVFGRSPGGRRKQRQFSPSHGSNSSHKQEHLTGNFKRNTDKCRAEQSPPEAPLHRRPLASHA